MQVSINSFAYAATIYLPLKLRNWSAKAFGFLTSSDLPSVALCRLFKGKFLVGKLPDGNVLYYPLDDLKILEIIAEVYKDKIYDIDKIESFKQVLDVGSHIGLFTLRVSKLASRSKITAIEANKVNFEFLQKNIAANNLSERTILKNVASGNRNGKITLWVGKFSRGDSSIKRSIANSNECMAVNVFPLDDLLNHETWDLIKIDVEGAEADTLKGLKKTAHKTHLIAMELHKSLVAASEVEQLLAEYDFTILVNRPIYENCAFLVAER